ncbi:MAG: homoserine O-acetyltransferase [Fibrobacterota bacterium]|nr:homoserine O-acetyltransferase [Fibrobacterota bacterium]
MSAQAEIPEPKTAAEAGRMEVETRILKLDLPAEGFRLVSGKALKTVEVAYETYGVLNAAKSNAVLICSPLTTDAHAAGFNPKYDKAKERIGWWDDMIGPGKAIDTNRYFVIASNMLGGCKGTTGPSSADPATGRPYGSAFPKITVEDMVGVQRLLALQLGIDVLEAVVGGSMGGMQALQWSTAYPDKVRKCICIAAAACLSAQALGFEIIGRKAIVNDPDFRSGDFYGDGKIPGRGLAFARMIGHLTYLSALSMHEKFGRNRKEDCDENRFETGFEVEGYLNHQGDQFVKRFDANSYLHITWAMDHFDLVARYGSLDKAFAPSKAEFLLVALSSDWLFFPEQTRELGRVLLNQKKIVSLVELQSPYGHDAFLLEVANLSQVLHGFLEKPAFDNGHGKPKAPHQGVRANGSDQETAGSSQPIRSECFGAAQDIRALASLMESGSHILDIGCGDGVLIDSMYKSHGVTGIGIDISLNHVVECLRKNVPVLQSDADGGLSLISDGAFDYAVLNRTLQEVKKPQLVLNEMLRVARKGIVAFPNFAFAGNRLALLTTGVMPVSEALPYNWHDTPNIHLFSLDDFRLLCGRQGIRIEKILYLGDSLLSKVILGLGRPNLGSEFVIARISKEP